MYQYIGCGLDNVWLTDGYQVKQTPYGTSVSVENVEGLHNAIGQYLVDSKPALSGKEFRFLRSELEMSQKSFGDLLGVTDQAVARWEKLDKVETYGDRWMRVLYKLYRGGSPDIVALVSRLNEMEKINFEKMAFGLDKQDTVWKQVGT